MTRPLTPPSLAAALLTVACAACASAPAAAPPHGSQHGGPHGAEHGAEHGGGHHDGHHRFENAEQWAERFDAPSRDPWQKPDDVVRGLALRGDEVVADIGAGTGYFAMRLARALPRGKVLAVDVEKDMVRYLGERAQKEGLTNVIPVLAPTDDPALGEPVDVVLVVDTVHHIEGRPAYFTKVKQKLKPEGRLVIVDFKMGDIPVGPGEKMRITPDALTAEMKSAGFALVSVDDQTLPYQYIAVYR